MIAGEHMPGNFVNERTCTAVQKGCNERFDSMERRLEKLFDLANRPPVWVTVVIGILMALCGWLSKGVL